MDQKVTINRSLVGWLSLAFLAGFVISLVTDKAMSGRELFSRRCSARSLWLALPKDGSLGKWSEVSISQADCDLLIIITAVRSPKKFVPYLPILLAIAAAGRI